MTDEFKKQLQADNTGKHYADDYRDKEKKRARRRARARMTAAERERRRIDLGYEPLTFEERKRILALNVTLMGLDNGR